MSTNIEDDDAPPELVDVSAMPSDQHGPIEEESTPRVPITLVTGMKSLEGSRLKLNMARQDILELGKQPC